MDNKMTDAEKHCRKCGNTMVGADGVLRIGVWLEKDRYGICFDCGGIEYHEFEKPQVTIASEMRVEA